MLSIYEYMAKPFIYIPWKQSSWGQHGVHLGPVGSRWAPCWPHEPCYQGCSSIVSPNGWRLNGKIESSYRNMIINNILQTTSYTLPSEFSNMMTSSNGNIFRVIVGEFTGPGEFPTQRPVTRSFDVFFDLRLNKRLSKQPWGWWFEVPSWSLWR